MTSEIQQELIENYLEMVKLIGKQEFRVNDAQMFLARYLNIIRKMEDLEKSCEYWREKYKAIKDEN